MAETDDLAVGQRPLVLAYGRVERRPLAERRPRLARVLRFVEEGGLVFAFLMIGWVLTIPIGMGLEAMGLRATSYVAAVVLAVAVPGGLVLCARSRDRNGPRLVCMLLAYLVLIAFAVWVRWMLPGF